MCGVRVWQRGGWCCGYVRGSMREAESGTYVVELLHDAKCVMLLRVRMLCAVVVDVCLRGDENCDCGWCGEQKRVVEDGGVAWK